MECEYSKILPEQDTFSIIGIWNIPKREQEKYWNRWNMEYSRNIPKSSKTIERSKILVYVIFHEIFLENFKNCITSHGGVKFNQAHE